VWQAQQVHVEYLELQGRMAPMVPAVYQEFLVFPESQELRAHVVLKVLLALAE
jgi:hypothetical protein